VIPVHSYAPSDGVWPRLDPSDPLVVAQRFVEQEGWVLPSNREVLRGRMRRFLARSLTLDGKPIVPTAEQVDTAVIWLDAVIPGIHRKQRPARR
jgi:hypothetical protein